MKERPILFSAPMVRALLEGRKTQTRRVHKHQPIPWVGPDPPGWPGACPYGTVGGRLWVRETWAGGVTAEPSSVDYRADGKDYGADDQGRSVIRWTPSIHMPRWASRITLEVTGVRVERPQEISEADAVAEGVERVIVGEGWRRYNADPRDDAVGDWPCDTARESYETLWESINGAGSWDSNPWVWVIEFKRVTP